MSEFNPYATPSSSPQEEEIYDDQSPRPMNYATRGERFLGNLIDTVILLIPIVTIAVGVGFLFPSQLESVFVEILFGILGLVMMVLIQGYFWKTRSQSIGKIVMKTQIVDLDGRPSSFNTICWKRMLPIGVATLIPGIGNVVGIANALMIFREEHNCLHDDIASTRVIKLPY